MRTLPKFVSWLALAGLLVLPAIYLAGGIALPALKAWLLAITVAWFASVPFWMDRRPDRE